MTNLTPRDRLIIALDVPTLRGAEKLVQSLAPHCSCFKVGLELLHGAGTPAVMDFIAKMGGTAFVDAKLCDIPATVGRATDRIAQHAPLFINMMAEAGPEAVRAAVAHKRHSRILVVTVLTSIDAPDLDALGYLNRSVPDIVLKRMQMAAACGADGVVCSADDLRHIGRILPAGLEFVCPGIRAADAPPDDQKRTVTAYEAMQLGATRIVVGRPITAAPCPVAAAQVILKQLQAP